MRSFKVGQSTDRMTPAIYTFPLNHRTKSAINLSHICTADDSNKKVPAPLAPRGYIHISPPFIQRAQVQCEAPCSLVSADSEALLCCSRSLAPQWETLSSLRRGISILTLGRRDWVVFFRVSSGRMPMRARSHWVCGGDCRVLTTGMRGAFACLLVSRCASSDVDWASSTGV